MKHLVLVAGIYYPNPSPTGQCAGRYISLLKDRYTVDVIFIQSGKDKTPVFKQNNETLYALSNWRLSLEDRLMQAQKKAKTDFMHKISACGIRAVKAFGKIQSLLLFPNNLKWFRNKAYRELYRIHKQNPIDVVFTVNAPFAAHLAGEKFKKRYKDVRWVTYTVDPFYTRHRCWKRMAGLRCNRALTSEKRALFRADAVFLSEEVFENCKELYDGIAAKTIPLPYLLWYNNTLGDNRFNPEKVNLVYAGRFFKDIRSPEYLLKTFLLIDDEDIILHLYSSSNCEAVIDEYVKKAGGRIVKHGLVDAEEIKAVLAGADVLVNVGNAVAEVKPSKTFEYLSTGKPIIHFYQKDLRDELLQKYPYSLQISDRSDCGKAAADIRSFCHSTQGKASMFREIESLFYNNSSDYVRKILIHGTEKQ